MRERNIIVSNNKQNVAKTAEACMYLLNILSNLLPVCIFLSTFHPMEPSHIILEQWFEIHWAPSLFIVLLLLAGYAEIMGCCNLLVTVAILALCHYTIATAIIDDLTPVAIVKRKDRQLVLATNSYGKLEDTEILQM